MTLSTGEATGLSGQASKVAQVGETPVILIFIAGFFLGVQQNLFRRQVAETFEKVAFHPSLETEVFLGGTRQLSGLIG